MRTIKSKREFAWVFSNGKRLNHPLVRIIVCDTDEGSAGKLAFVAAKRLGNAVYRNRCKRVLREAARQTGLPLESTHVMLFATNKTHDASPYEVSGALKKLIKRAEL